MNYADGSWRCFGHRRRVSHIARCCAAWCAFDGFRTTYLGISAFTSSLSLIRSNPPTRRTQYKSDLHANHHATNAALDTGWEIFPVALFPRNLRLDHIALRSILSLPIMQAKGGGRLLPSYCTCAIDQRNTRYHPSIECSVHFKKGSQSDSTLLLEGRVAI